MRGVVETLLIVAVVGSFGASLAVGQSRHRSRVSLMGAGLGGMLAMLVLAFMHSWIVKGSFWLDSLLSGMGFPDFYPWSLFLRPSSLLYANVAIVFAGMSTGAGFGWWLANVVRRDTGEGEPGE